MHSHTRTHPESPLDVNNSKKKHVNIRKIRCSQDTFSGNKKGRKEGRGGVEERERERERGRKKVKEREEESERKRNEKREKEIDRAASSNLCEGLITKLPLK